MPMCTGEFSEGEGFLCGNIVQLHATASDYWLACDSERASLGSPTWDERFSLLFSSTLSYVGDEGSQERREESEDSSEESVRLTYGAEDACSSGASEAGSGVKLSTANSGPISKPSAASSVHSSNGKRSIVDDRFREGEEREQASAAASQGKGDSQALARHVSREKSSSLDKDMLTGHLQASAKIVARVKLGTPLSMVPGFLLSYTGGLVATAVLQALMPTLLELLGRDYERWADGQARLAASNDAQGRALVR